MSGSRKLPVRVPCACGAGPFAYESDLRAHLRRHLDEWAVAVACSLAFRRGLAVRFVSAEGPTNGPGAAGTLTK